MPAVSACELLVGGMTCAACTGAVQGALLKHSGVFQAQVEILRETARIVYDSNVVTPEQLCAVVEGLGFESQVLQIFVSSPESPQQNNSRTTARSADESAGGDLMRSQGSPEGNTEPEHPAGCHAAVSQGSKATLFEGTTAPKSLATLRLVLPDAGEFSASAAYRSLENNNGVVGCAVAPTRRPDAQRSKQLIITYTPEVVGARTLLSQLIRQGFRPFLLAEDPLEAQASNGPRHLRKSPVIY